MTAEPEFGPTASKPRLVIYLPAVERRVTLGQYCEAIRKAKANPDMEFRHSLTGWWPASGGEIMQQFRDGIHDRINQRGLREKKAKKDIARVRPLAYTEPVSNHHNHQ